MKGKLSTHVLDVVKGGPAVGMKLELWSLDRKELLKTVLTNHDGRTDSPLLGADEIAGGTYEILFHAGDYFGEKSFLDVIPLRFNISDPSAGYHVPLLCSPWTYSTYRGS
jgi:5-hydroxyisourate hydrolase